MRTWPSSRWRTMTSEIVCAISQAWARTRHAVAPPDSTARTRNRRVPRVNCSSLGSTTFENPWRGASGRHESDSGTEVITW